MQRCDRRTPNIQHATFDVRRSTAGLRHPASGYAGLVIVFVQFGGHDGANGEIIVASARWRSPTDQFAGAVGLVEDAALHFGDIALGDVLLGLRTGRILLILEVAAGIDQSDELPEQFALALAGEPELLDRNHLAARSVLQLLFEITRQPGADPGGVDDDQIGFPDIAGQSDDFLLQLVKLLAGPEHAIDHPVDHRRNRAVDPDDGQGSAVAAAVACHGGGVGAELFLAGDIDGQTIAGARPGRSLPQVIALHARHPVRVEVTLLTIQLLQLIFGPDERVPLTELGDPVLDPIAVPGNMLRDLLPRNHEQPRFAGLGAFLADVAHLPGEQGLVGPGGAHEEGGRVGAGRHRIEDRIPNAGIDILRLVRNQQQIGCLAADIGIGIGREEAGGGIADFDDVAIADSDMSFQQTA